MARFERVTPATVDSPSLPAPLFDVGNNPFDDKDEREGLLVFVPLADEPTNVVKADGSPTTIDLLAQQVGTSWGGANVVGPDGKEIHVDGKPLQIRLTVSTYRERAKSEKAEYIDRANPRARQPLMGRRVDVRDANERGAAANDQVKAASIGR